MAGGFFGAGGGPSAVDPLAAPLVPQCGACGLARKCNNPKPGPQGQGGKRILLVGGSPSQAEDRPGRLFSDGNGQRVRSALAALGVDVAADCWVTNAAICATGRGVPTPEQTRHCRPNLTQTIDRLQPQTIITFGPEATAAVVSRAVGPAMAAGGGVKKWAGHRIPCQANRAWVCPVLPAADIAREEANGKRGQPTVGLWWHRHLTAALDTTHHRRPAQHDWVDRVRVVTDHAQAAQYLDNITARGTGCVAFDYEGTGLKPEGPDAAIISAAVAWGVGDQPKRVFAYPWAGDAVAATGRLLRSPLPKVAANMKFEERWTRWAFGHGVRNWVWDTMLAAHWADPRESISGLKFQAYIHLGQPDYDSHIKPYLDSPDAMTANRIREIPLTELLVYNGMDSLLEYMLAAKQCQAGGVPRPW